MSLLRIKNETPKAPLQGQRVKLFQMSILVFKEEISDMLVSFMTHVSNVLTINWCFLLFSRLRQIILCICYFSLLQKN